MRIFSLIFLITPLCWAAENAHRCDQQGIKRLSELHKERCEDEYNSEVCPTLMKDIYDYMSAMHSRNDAFCQRISHRYGIVIHKQEPRRLRR